MTYLAVHHPVVLVAHLVLAHPHLVQVPRHHQVVAHQAVLAVVPLVVHLAQVIHHHLTHPHPLALVHQVVIVPHHHPVQVVPRPHHLVDHRHHQDHHLVLPLEDHPHRQLVLLIHVM